MVARCATIIEHGSPSAVSIVIVVSLRIHGRVLGGVRSVHLEALHLRHHARLHHRLAIDLLLMVLLSLRESHLLLLRLQLLHDLLVISLLLLLLLYPLLVPSALGI